jgi:hypothetical protein
MKNALKAMAYIALAASLALGFVVTAHAHDRSLVNISYIQTR